MKVARHILIVLLLVFGITACRSSQENVSKTNNYDEWLAKHSEPAKVNVGGEWNAGNAWEGGWGGANLVQQGAMSWAI